MAVLYFTDILLVVLGFNHLLYFSAFYYLISCACLIESQL